MINYNKIISNILNYDNPSDFDEIYRCLTLMKYKIEESDVEKYDRILSLLIDEKKDIYYIIDSHNEIPISKLEKTINEITSDIIDCFNYDMILKDNKDNLSEIQIQNIANKIKENISGNSYNYTRIKDLLKILNDKIILAILEEYMLIDNINNSGKLFDAVDLLKSNEDFFEKSKILEFLNIVLKSNNEKSKIFDVIYEFRNYVSIDIIKQIPNIIVSIMDNNIYDKTFRIYEQNIELIKTDELCSNSVCNFLTIDVKNTDKMKKSFGFLKDNFKCVIKLTDFIMGYLEYSGNKNNEDEYFKTISHYLAQENDIKKIYDELLCKRELSDIELKKLDNLFEKFEIVTDINDINNEIYLMNVWKKCLNSNNIGKIDLFLKECNSGNVISSCIEQLLSKKIKFNARVKKANFYDTLVNIKNKFNNSDINKNVDLLIEINNLISKKDLVH